MGNVLQRSEGHRGGIHAEDIFRAREPWFLETILRLSSIVQIGFEVPALHRRAHTHITPIGVVMNPCAWNALVAKFAADPAPIRRAEPDQLGGVFGVMHESLMAWYSQIPEFFVIWAHAGVDAVENMEFLNHGIRLRPVPLSLVADIPGADEGFFTHGPHLVGEESQVIEHHLPPGAGARLLGSTRSDALRAHIVNMLGSSGHHTGRFRKLVEEFAVAVAQELAVFRIRPGNVAPKRSKNAGLVVTDELIAATAVVFEQTRAGLHEGARSVEIEGVEVKIDAQALRFRDHLAHDPAVLLHNLGGKGPRLRIRLEIKQIEEREIVHDAVAVFRRHHSDEIINILAFEPREDALPGIHRVHVVNFQAAPWPWRWFKNAGVVCVVTEFETLIFH